MLAFQEENHLLNHSVVFLASGIGNARRDTAMNIVLRAWTRQKLLFERVTIVTAVILAVTWRSPGAGIVATGAEREELIQQVERRVNGSRIGVGAKVAVAIAMKAAHTVDARKILRERHFNIGIVFIVAHQHIIFGTILLDIITFQDKRLDLVLDNNELDIINLCHHTAILRTEVG